jgi:YegS/Rv2252/BmrU family lipid kinase
MIKLIANPIAGRGKGGKVLPQVREALSRAGLEFSEALTTKPLEAIDLARQAAEEGYKLVVAMGGDGTSHEVANGILSSGNSEVALGLIPIGTGNDFADMFDTPTDLAQVAHRLWEGKTRLIDVGRVNDRYFVNVLGTGFDALVSIQALKIQHVLRGFPLYLAAVFITLKEYQIPHITVEFDGERLSMPMTMINVANGKREGGGFLIAPDAQNDDGIFDICLARGLGRLGILRLLPEVIKGTHVDKEPVTMAKAKRVILDSPDPLPVHADGEIIYTDAHHLEIEIIPRRLRVIT